MRFFLFLIALGGIGYYVYSEGYIEKFLKSSKGAKEKNLHEETLRQCNSYLETVKKKIAGADQKTPEGKALYFKLNTGVMTLELTCYEIRKTCPVDSPSHTTRGCREAIENYNKYEPQFKELVNRTK